MKRDGIQRCSVVYRKNQVKNSRGNLNRKIDSACEHVYKSNRSQMTSVCLIRNFNFFNFELAHILQTTSGKVS